MRNKSELDGPHFTTSELRLKAKLALPYQLSNAVFDPSQTGERGDFDLNPDMLPPHFASVDLRAAAVLVPIVDRHPEPTVLLTQRTEEMPTHAGQIAFPGGKIETQDNGPLETALREAEEEVGLSPSHVEVLGFLDNYQTATGFHIAPAVAIVENNLSFIAQTQEVAEIFEVPLRFLMDSGNHQLHSRKWNGRDRYFYAMPYEDRYIWGATAGILRNLYERLYDR